MRLLGYYLIQCVKRSLDGRTRRRTSSKRVIGREHCQRAFERRGSLRNSLPRLHGRRNAMISFAGCGLWVTFSETQFCPYFRKIHRQLLRLNASSFREVRGGEPAVSSSGQHIRDTVVHSYVQSSSRLIRC